MIAAGGALLTDFYELTMLQAYWRGGMRGRAVFEFFVRRLPARRNFLLAAGLAQVLEYLAALRFTAAELAWLRADGRFDPAFVATLADWRFDGDVDALPEGTVCFAGQPIVRVSAALPQAQLVESRLMNLLHFQTMVASKAARVCLAAGDHGLVDFGLRRAHGAEAGLLSVRASYLAGFDATATTAAALFGIPVFGTMAHSYVQAHAGEAAAFAAWLAASARPASATGRASSRCSTAATAPACWPASRCCVRRCAAAWPAPAPRRWPTAAPTPGGSWRRCRPRCAGWNRPRLTPAR